MKSDICWEVIPTPRPERTESEISSIKSLKETLAESNPLKSHIDVEPMKTLKKSDLLFIKDLDPSEKSKIALMIQQIIRLEQNCTELTKDYENMKMKFDSKSNLCNEVQECMERLSSENDLLKNKLLSKDELLHQNSAKLGKTNELLKLTSSTNKKLQKKLNTRKRHVEVQTETDCHYCDISLQTSFFNSSPSTWPAMTAKTPPPPAAQVTVPHPAPAGHPHDSMTVFLSKLDTLCDKLSAIDKNPPVRGEGGVLVHNHKTEGVLVAADTTVDVVYRAPEEERGGVIEPGRIRDSIILLKEQGDTAHGVQGVGSNNMAEVGVHGYNSKLFSIIDELEGVSQDDDEETLLCDLFYKV